MSSSTTGAAAANSFASQFPELVSALPAAVAASPPPAGVGWLQLNSSELSQEWRDRTAARAKFSDGWVNYGELKWLESERQLLSKHKALVAKAERENQVQALNATPDSSVMSRNQAMSKALFDGAFDGFDFRVASEKSGGDAPIGSARIAALRERRYEAETAIFREFDDFRRHLDKELREIVHKLCTRVRHVFDESDQRIDDFLQQLGVVCKPKSKPKVTFR